MSMTWPRAQIFSLVGVIARNLPGIKRFYLHSFFSRGRKIYKDVALLLVMIVIFYYLFFFYRSSTALIPPYQ